MFVQNPHSLFSQWELTFVIRGQFPVVELGSPLGPSPRGGVRGRKQSYEPAVSERPRGGRSTLEGWGRRKG